MTRVLHARMLTPEESQAADVKRREDEAKRREQAEHDRLQKRAAVKQRIAAAIVAGRRADELAAAIATIEGRKESLAASHTEKCRPWIEERQKLERDEIDAVLKGEPANQARSARRAELLDQLQQANVELKKAVAAENSLIGPLEAERVAAAKAGYIGTLQRDLCDLASPAARQEWKLAVSALAWARARRDAARSYRDQFDAAGNRPSTLKIRPPLVTAQDWDEELAEATTAVSAAESRERAAWQRCLDE